MTKDPIIPSEKKHGFEPVATIVTAMTDDEEQFLEECLRAILNETHITSVIVCIAESNTWINKIDPIILNDPRMKLLPIPLYPIGKVRNIAIENITENWVAFCDGDDVWVPNKTSLQLDFATKQQADLVASGHILISEKGRKFAYGLALYLPMPSSWLVKTEILRKYPFQENTFSGSDGTWWIATHNKIRKVKYPEALLHYRVRANSVSSRSTSKKRKEHLEKLSKIPLLGSLLYYSSYWTWLYTRNKPFRWLKKWNSEL